MKKNLLTAFLMTLATTILLGIVYPLVVTGLAQLLFRDKANGSLVARNGEVVGSRLIGQRFVSEQYFHSRPSAAGSGYDAANSAASNLGPTNQKLVDRVKTDTAAAQAENSNTAVPIDLVTASASGLDPDISPAAAFFQVPRIARVRNLPENRIRALVEAHVENRIWGLLGEPHVNVLELNLTLDQATTLNTQ